MALRTATRLGVDASVRAARLPFDLGTRFVGGPESALALAVDRADARARALAGFILGDADLQDDAARRHAATDERVRALSLREQAERTSEHADQRVAGGERPLRAGVPRRTSSARARKAQAEERRRSREAEATQAADRGRRSTEAAKAAKQRTVQARTDEARLDALEEKAEALEQEEEALVASDEAKRLARAAGTAKARRKEPSNGSS